MDKIKLYGVVFKLLAHPIEQSREEMEVAQVSLDSAGQNTLLFDVRRGSFLVGDFVCAEFPTDFALGWDSTEGIELRRVDKENG